MDVINFAEHNLSNDFDVYKNIAFSKDSWRIQYQQSEHVTFDFDFLLNNGKDRLSNHPELQRATKILTYYNFPNSVRDNVKSWRSAYHYYAIIKRWIIYFFYKKSLINYTLISSIDKNQIIHYIDSEIKLAEFNKKTWALYVLTRFLNMWSELSEAKLLPKYLELKYKLTDVLKPETAKNINKFLDDAQNTWTPLHPETIKTCFDESVNYIRVYSGSIIEANNLIRSRPRNKAKEKTVIGMVRSDGKTKDIFKKLSTLETPYIVGTTTKLFSLRVITKRVKSRGYKCGWQDRTWVEIKQVRPQVIHLKRACIFIIGLFTGMRRREIAELEAKPTYTKNGNDYLDITRFKTSHDPNDLGEPDSIPVPKIVAEAIDVLLRLFAINRQELNSDYLLVTDIVTSKKYEKIKIDTVGKDVRAFIEEFGGESGHAHQLRKTLAWLLISRSEANVDLIRQLFGHKSYGMTLRYILRNELMVANVMELIEHNYTKDLHEALTDIADGKAAGKLAEEIRNRADNQRFKGQLLATDIETFVHESLAAGVPLFVSQIPIGGFCICAEDLSEKLPPCIVNSKENKPQPEFCDYKKCPHVLFNKEAISNIGKQISYYQTKLRYLDDSSNDALIEHYENEVIENQALLKRTKSKEHFKEELIDTVEVESESV